MEPTIIQELGEFHGNHLYIKREDLIPYSFGGNKARKGILFFQEIDKGSYDAVVTYGSSHSNHCRVVANMAAARGMCCVIIGPKEVSDQTFNSHMMELFGAQIITVSVDRVHDAIEETLEELRRKGKKPYFIPGGGHGNIGTEAFVQCYEEIRNQGQFDYIFFASGTGTTHAGLVCGKLKFSGAERIIGISIARKNPRGRQVVLDSIREYMGEDNRIEDATIFIDNYVGPGYGKEDSELKSIIKDVLVRYGIPLDSTYTAKAFNGMIKFIQERDIREKKILFIHTGGTPLFFDGLNT